MLIIKTRAGEGRRGLFRGIRIFDGHPREPFANDVQIVGRQPGFKAFFGGLDVTPSRLEFLASGICKFKLLYSAMRLVPGAGHKSCPLSIADNDTYSWRGQHGQPGNIRIRKPGVSAGHCQHDKLRMGLHRVGQRVLQVRSRSMCHFFPV